MGTTTLRLAVAMVIFGCALRAIAQDLRVPTAVWATKPTKLSAYTPPQEPWVKLPDLKAAHKGQPNWRDVIVDDGRLTGEYVLTTPGTGNTLRLEPRRPSDAPRH